MDLEMNCCPLSKAIVPWRNTKPQSHFITIVSIYLSINSCRSVSVRLFWDWLSGVSLFILPDDSIDEILDFLWVVPNHFWESFKNYCRFASFCHWSRLRLEPLRFRTQCSAPRLSQSWRVRWWICLLTRAFPFRSEHGRLCTEGTTLITKKVLSMELHEDGLLLVLEFRQFADIRNGNYALIGHFFEFTL